MFAKLAVAFLAFTGASLALPTRSIEARNLGRGQFPFFASNFFLADVLPATYYEPAGGYGACGNVLQNTDMVVALSADQYLAGANCQSTSSPLTMPK